MKFLNIIIIFCLFIGCAPIAAMQQAQNRALNSMADMADVAPPSYGDAQWQIYVQGQPGLDLAQERREGQPGPDLAQERGEDIELVPPRNQNIPPAQIQNRVPAAQQRNSCCSSSCCFKVTMGLVTGYLIGFLGGYYVGRQDQSLADNIPAMSPANTDVTSMNCTSAITKNTFFNNTEIPSAHQLNNYNLGTLSKNYNRQDAQEAKLKQLKTKMVTAQRQQQTHERGNNSSNALKRMNKIRK